jgi:hypothetical protein
MLVGSGVLLWTFHRYEHLDSSAGMLLGVFGVVPWLSLLIGLQVDGVATFALSRTVGVGFLAGGFAAASLVGLTDLFGTVPAAGNVGPATVVEELGDVVVVTDGEGTVVELNAAAQRQLAVTAADVVGADVGEMLDAGLAELRTTGTVELCSGTGSTTSSSPRAPRPSFAPARSSHSSRKPPGTWSRSWTAPGRRTGQFACRRSSTGHSQPSRPNTSTRLANATCRPTSSSRRRRSFSSSH